MSGINWLARFLPSAVARSNLRNRRVSDKNACTYIHSSIIFAASKEGNICLVPERFSQILLHLVGNPIGKCVKVRVIRESVEIVKIG